MKHFNLIKNIVLISVILVLALLYNNKHEKLQEERSFREAVEDTLVTYKDKEGNYISRISTIQSHNTQLLLESIAKDSAIAKLQEEVKDAKRDGGLKEPGSSVSVVERETDVDIIVPSTTDELENKLAIRSTFNLDDWVIGSIFARRDSTEINLQVYDAFSVRVDYEQQGFLGLGKPKPFSELTSKNPYSKTKTFRTYQVSTPPPANIVIGPSIGIGFSGMTLEPMVGVSVTYPLIRFRL